MGKNVGIGASKVELDRLHVPSLDCSLINPFIMRLAGIVVDECPKFLAEIPSIAHHSLYFPDQHLRIPLALDGIVSCFPCRIPRGEELTDPSTFLALSPSGEKWNPHDVTYKKQEESMTDFRGDIKPQSKRKFIVSQVVSRTMDPSLFAFDLETSGSYSPFSQYYVGSIKTFDGKDSSLDPSLLARTWNIGLETAKRTIQATTRLCPRNTTTITLNKRYASNDRMIRYKHLNCVMFSDTMFAAANSGKSVKNFTCVQVFATDF